ncbi:hypothetical protein RFI_16816 [Reticulomyxa filosa]|uniref:Uncharacterized protein n=1 Tax=Reticulomyxa filosa TaxID=46433 RepID=X6N3U8_RETFI|nr:hypothetical protein RFI_16816 [Reticulomyxa filosa]|eukprot:ETO20404.1 hypothetical protein RFI_16816 [Reticulomyxa filosa]
MDHPHSLFADRHKKIQSTIGSATTRLSTLHNNRYKNDEDGDGDEDNDNDDDDNDNDDDDDVGNEPNPSELLDPTTPIHVSTPKISTKDSTMNTMTTTTTMTTSMTLTSTNTYGKLAIMPSMPFVDIPKKIQIPTLSQVLETEELRVNDKALQFDGEPNVFPHSTPVMLEHSFTRLARTPSLEQDVACLMSPASIASFAQFEANTTIIQSTPTTANVFVQSQQHTPVLESELDVNADHVLYFLIQFLICFFFALTIKCNNTLFNSCWIHHYN